MPAFYPFRADADWYNWGRSFSRQVTTDQAALGVSVEAAASVQSAYVAFATAYELATDPDTRSKPRIDGKDETLRQFREAVIPVIAILKTNPALTTEQRTQLGVKSRDTSPTPSNVPGAAPTATAIVTGAQTARLVVRDPAAEDRRAKPTGVRTVEIHCLESAKPVGDPADWPIEQLAGKTTVDLYFPDAMGPTDLWFSVCWVSGRHERGPMSTPVAVRLGGVVGREESASEEGDTEMRIAA